MTRDLAVLFFVCFWLRFTGAIQKWPFLYTNVLDGRF